MIRTQDRDAATGALACAANFTLVIPPIKTSHAFPDGVTKNGAADYKVEKTDDGQIYVTVLQADRPYWAALRPTTEPTVAAAHTGSGAKSAGVELDFFADADSP